jgi:hypothetical protein
MTIIIECLLWGSIVISITTSLVRATNIGFQRETYILSAISLIPIIYDIWFTGSNQVILYNILHILIALFGAYRHRWGVSAYRESRQLQNKKRLL